jgi:hypothetical protein
MENLHFCSEDIKELAGAMLKVQAELNPAVKDASNPFAKSRYATLNSVITASREALLKHGVWVVQYPVPVESGHLGLMTRFIHASSGQWQSSLMVMPLSKSDPQGYGSALTYARRYSLASMVGLITEDDDAEAACGRSNKCHPNQTQVKTQSTSNELLSHKSGNGSSNGTLSNEDLVLLSNLPQLNGISYQSVTANDGKICVVATGNTMSQKEGLKSNGFIWNPQRKVWWRYADDA